MADLELPQVLSFGEAYYSARADVVFLSPVGFFKKASAYYILFLECILKTKMVVGSPRIMADTSYDVIDIR